MTDTFGLLFGAILRVFLTRRMLLLENLALRQQLAALKRRDARPRLAVFDKLFWVMARRFWSGWKQELIVVNPETVVQWHRAGFRLYWKLISKVRRPIGRRKCVRLPTPPPLGWSARRPLLLLHAPEGTRLVGFDNAHDVPARGSRFKRRKEGADHWHRTDKDPGRPYEFKDAETLINDFFDEVERVLRDRGIGLRVTRTEVSRRSK